jgi:putative ABC transport system ATP-binding protein
VKSSGKLILDIPYKCVIFDNKLGVNDMENRVIMKAEHVEKTFRNGEHVVHAVNDISFEIKKGELVIILGPSGAGKSTLLNLIGGMDTLTSGQLFVNDEDIGKYNRIRLTEYRRNQIGFVFQFYNLMPNLTAKENVELSTELKKDSLKPEDVLASVGLKERMDNFPSQLSGGEQQRVSIARALAKNPDIILCDEPTGALDYVTGKEILSLLSNAARKENKTVVIVTHNSALSEMGNHLVRIKNGTVVEDLHNEAPKDIKDIEW